ncbi:hypothetical protein ACLQ2R_00795 [Streptosporangium sp. DT93]|uniref:hypothetical protein n=1 Tax=Streptosporangium sp. DT93 TaxID=3393428 RepID=UPI003CE696D5
MRSPALYAGLDGCLCAPWRLWLRGGDVVDLADARVFSSRGRRAPLALSPNGGHVAYFDLGSGALVVRKVVSGTVRAVPGVTWSSAMRATRIELSPRGRYAVLGVGEEYRILDTLSGTSLTVRPGLRPWSFSPDAEFVLAVDDAFQAVVYAMSPFAERGRAPLGGALGPEGETVAHFTESDAGIGLWSVPSGVPAASAPIAVPYGMTPTRLRWNVMGHLDLQTVVSRRARKGGGNRYGWYRIDRETGEMERIRRFVVPGSVHHPIVAGLSP